VAVAIRLPDLGRVDLDEPHAGAVRVHGGVPVDDAVDPERRGRLQGGDEGEAGDGQRDEKPHRTTSVRASLPLFPQSILTGQRPACVFVPTRHRQLILPPVLGESPWARETTVS
jgi:hypothetical protein